MVAITYSLAPEPVWVLINLVGTVAGGGYIITKHSQNKDLLKYTFTDSSGEEEWPNPTFFDLNGVHAPIYWEVDPANLSDTYFVQAFDAQGALLWEVDNFSPSGTGGGGNVTNYNSIVNYIANNQFINHIPDTALPIDPTVATNLVIAPSNHKGFTPALVNPVVGTYGVVGPDIRFIKNNTLANDQITFPSFTLGTNPLTPDFCPAEYVRYQCTNSPSGETYKDFQFPICQKIQTLTNQPMTFTLWAAVTTTPETLTIYVRQYYGSGTATTPESTSTRVLVGTAVLSTTWTRFNIQFTIANASGNSIGTPGLQTNDDATYIEIEMPLGIPCDILFTKPSLYLGSINPGAVFEDYDQIDSINSTARTGDVRVSLTSAAPLGWLLMNDTTIGNTGSGATTAGAFTFQLYKTLWDGVLDTWAPVSTGRGGTAIADFLAGKTLTMPLSLGRALAGAGTGTGLSARVLGQNTGTETNTLTKANLPNPLATGLGLTGVTPTVGTSVFVNNTIGSGILINTGGGQPTNNMQPTSFMNVFIKL